jgi:ATP-dependent DNA helicase RecG
VTKTELLEIIKNGENSGVEFKRDDVRPESLAKEIAAFLNLQGGHVLLGVEDDGSVTGLTRDPHDAEEWIMQICRVHLQPAIIPFWEVIRSDQGMPIGIISLPSDSPDKPYKSKRGQYWQVYVRVGSTSREATREEEARLYQASGLMRYDVKPVPGSGLADLDMRRLENYFRDVRQQEVPAREDQAGWRQLLVNTEMMVEQNGMHLCSAGGLLLFGSRPNRFLPQAGISAAAYPGRVKDYATRERAVLRGPIASLTSHEGELLEPGIIEQAIDFVRRNTAVEARIDATGVRQDRWKDYPLEAVRETIVNAVAHRDYTIAVTDIELSLYEDRLEVISPGRLPNTVTVEGMKLGVRASRNELIKEVLRDYRYIEATGLGVPRKIIQGMREHNDTEPDLIEEDIRFIVRLWR